MSSKLSSNDNPALYNETVNGGNQNIGYSNTGGVKLKNPFLDVARHISEIH